MEPSAADTCSRAVRDGPPWWRFQWMRKWYDWRWILVAAFLMPLIGQAQDVERGTQYLGREIAMTMHWTGANWLIRTKREREEAASTMRKELRLKPGMVACDMGCGNGYHTIPMAEAVGETGAVYAVDIQQEMLDLLAKRCEAKGISTVVPILGGDMDPKLPEDTMDLILMVDVYHEFSHPAEMLAGMRQSLREGGVVVLVEYREEDPTVPIKPLHKMSKAQINKEMKANGFKLVREFQELPWQHMMFFGRDDDASFEEKKAVAEGTEDSRKKTQSTQGE